MAWVWYGTEEKVDVVLKLCLKFAESPQRPFVLLAAWEKGIRIRKNQIKKIIFLREENETKCSKKSLFYK